MSAASAAAEKGSSVPCNCCRDPIYTVLLLCGCFPVFHCRPVRIPRASAPVITTVSSSLLPLYKLFLTMAIPLSYASTTSAAGCRPVQSCGSFPPKTVRALGLLTMCWASIALPRLHGSQRCNLRVHRCWRRFCHGGSFYYSFCAIDR